MATILGEMNEGEPTDHLLLIGMGFAKGGNAGIKVS